MADALTDKLIVSRRDKLRDDFLRNYKLKNPEADIGEGTEPFNKASAFADIEVVNHSNAVTIGQNISATTARGAALDEKLAEAGTRRLPATGASGYVRITASGGGGTIQAGDEIKIAGKRYTCAITAFYPDKAEVPLVGVDTGPGTDQRGGVIGKWTHPRPGIAQDAVVTAAGLRGGHDEEGDTEAQDRLRRLKSNPPASGNDAHIQLAALECPGVPIEQCFTYPAIRGPGTKAIVFTLRASAGGDRIPTALHRALMKQHLIDRFGVEDGILVCALVAIRKAPILRVRWSKQAKGWGDLAPLSVPDGSVARVTTVTDAMHFAITVPALDVVPPQAGKVLAFYDRATGKFKRKRVLSVSTAGAVHTIVCDSSNGASDVTFTPEVGAIASPWSDSLDTIVGGIRSYFDGLGPGEQVVAPFDPGLRQRRSPSSPEEWSSELSTRMIESTFQNNAVSSPKLIGLWDVAGASFAAVPYQTPVGSPTVASNLVTLGDLAVYPL